LHDGNVRWRRRAASDGNARSPARSPSRRDCAFLSVVRYRCLCRDRCRLSVTSSALRRAFDWWRVARVGGAALRPARSEPFLFMPRRQSARPRIALVADALRRRRLTRAADRYQKRLGQRGASHRRIAALLACAPESQTGGDGRARADRCCKARFPTARASNSGFAEFRTQSAVL